MDTIRHIRRIRRRLGAVLALLGAAVLTLTAAPAAFAMRVPPPGDPAVGSPPPQTSAVTHTVIMGGMPGWQIALIAVGAALLAATVAVLADRTRAARKSAIPMAALAVFEDQAVPSAGGSGRAAPPRGWARTVLGSRDQRREPRYCLR